MKEWTAALRAACVVGLLALALATQAWGQTTPPPPTVVSPTCSLGWDHGPDADLAAFRTYSAATSKGYVKGTYAAHLGQGKPPTVKTIYQARCADFKATTDGVYYLAVTAVDRAGNESDFSGEIVIRVDSGPPPPPENFRVLL
jgi:hypothetical protein